MPKFKYVGSETPIPMESKPVENIKPEVSQKQPEESIWATMANAMEPVTSTAGYEIPEQAREQMVSDIGRNVGAAIVRPIQGGVSAHGGIAEGLLGLGKEYISDKIPSYAQVQEDLPFLKVLAPTPKQSSDFVKKISGGKLEPDSWLGGFVQDVEKAFGSIGLNIGSVATGFPYVAKAAVGALAGKSAKEVVKGFGGGETFQTIADIGGTWLGSMPNGFKAFKDMETGAWEAVKHASPEDAPRLLARAKDITNGLEKTSKFNKFLQDNVSLSDELTNQSLKTLLLGGSTLFGPGLKKTAMGLVAAVTVRDITRAAEIMIHSKEGLKLYSKIAASALAGNVANASDVEATKKLNRLIEKKMPSMPEVVEGGKYRSVAKA